LIQGGAGGLGEQWGGEGRGINILQCREEGGEGRRRRRRGVYSNVCVDCPEPRRSWGAAKNVVLSSATEIVTVAHKQRVDKQSRNPVDDAMIGGVRRLGAMGGSGRLGMLEVGWWRWVRMQDISANISSSTLPSTPFDT
jgi:hypothetical protein